MLVRAWLFSTHICDEENDSKHDTKGADNNVANRKEIVSSTQHICGRQDKVLATCKGSHVVVVFNIQHVLSFLQVFGDLAVKFAEIGEACRSHPDNEMLVFNISPLCFFPITWQVFELVLDVWLPGNILIINCDSGTFCTIVILCMKCERIIEITFGDKTTWEGCCAHIKWGYSVIGVHFALQVPVCRDRITVA